VSACPQLGPRLAALHDDELPEDERHAALAHVAECAACAAALEDMGEVADLVADAVPLPEGPAWEAFDRDLRRSLLRDPAPDPFARRFRWLSSAAALAASLLLALYLAGWATEPHVALSWTPRHYPSLTSHQDPVVPRFVRDPNRALPPLSEVEGVEAARAALSPAEVAVLSSQGLVQTRSDARLHDLYPARVPRGVPAPLATADASLLLYGAVASRAARALEREVVVPGLRDLLALLVRELGAFERSARADVVREAARLARERIAVAAVLHGIDPRLPADSLERVEREVDRVRAAASREDSPLLGRTVDYRTFAPRGIYAEGPLRAHSQAARWLSVAGFSVDRSRPQELRAACLLVMALARGQLPGGAYGLYGQGQLEAAVEVLYGEPDELTAFDLLRSLQQAVPSAAPRLSVLAQEELLHAVADRVRREGDARGVDQVRALDAEAPRLFLLGNTRSLEARVLTRVSDPHLPHRTRPTSFDLLSLLARGSPRRLVHAIVTRPDLHGYEDALATLDGSGKAWRNPSQAMPYRAFLERSRLLAISALLDDEVPAGPAPFQGSLSYRSRLLMASLAGLNAPRGGARGPAPSADDLRGAPPLVEPLPRFHARLASAAKRLAGVLAVLGSDGPEVRAAILDLETVCRLEEALAEASLDALAGRPSRAAVAEALGGYGATLRWLGPADVRSAEDTFETRRGENVDVLHRVVRRLDRLYAIALDPVTKRPRLACGAALAADESWERGARLAPDQVDPEVFRAPLWAAHMERGR
jgi:hypothetical protein